MQIGMIGLGRMGANMVRRLMGDGHECVVYNRTPEPIHQLEGEGATGTHSLEELLSKLTPPRAAWIMVPAAFAGETVNQLADLMSEGDIIIDGGNSYYRDDVDRAEVLTPRGLHYIDVGTSGGVFGLERGYCLMIGGEEGPVTHLDPIFRSLAPGLDAASRTPGREGDPVPPEYGYLHCGPAGAGHFVKMVHNGIEYGLMAAYAEGLGILHRADVGKYQGDQDAETAPLQNPKYYQYEIDTSAVAELWRRGSVVSSWLLDLMAHALLGDPDLSGFSGRVSDSGEGRWTVRAAVDEGVPAGVLTTALFQRFSSQRNGDFADRMLSALRKEFGGHVEKPAG
ncbi:MAG: decarboxylating 6-phosphogluconate dehydrogenase [Actinomycetota bacterium]|nr:decarboxylating 6-phosphogluconate dehydrogenase [Actinomycetota bacterium]MDQ6948196.1 decarboxylating 6-phosphogluconate dehydrogenase [Actinomycetota bacterium]